jgi:flagellar motor switch protein FliN/FliY
VDAEARRNVVFARFVGRLGGEAAPPAVEASRWSLDAVVRRATGGALFARTSWWDGEENGTGCFLWIGAVGSLLADESGEPGKPAAALGPEEVRAIEDGLRQLTQDGVELRWSELVPVAPDDVVDVLRQAGVPDPCEVREVSLPIGGAETSMLFLVSQQDPRLPAPIAGPAFENLPKLLDIRVPLTIRLGSTRMALDEVLRLAPGSVVELDRREDEPLEILANGRVVAQGEVIVVDERFAVRVTRIGAVEERARLG